jgi:hypothetical protein
VLGASLVVGRSAVSLVIEMWPARRTTPIYCQWQSLSLWALSLWAASALSYGLGDRMAPALTTETGPSSLTTTTVAEGWSKL